MAQLLPISQAGPHPWRCQGRDLPGSEQAGWLHCPFPPGPERPPRQELGSSVNEVLSTGLVLHVTEHSFLSGGWDRPESSLVLRAVVLLLALVGGLRVSGQAGGAGHPALSAVTSEDPLAQSHELGSQEVWLREASWGFGY